MRASSEELLAARFWAKVQMGEGCWEWTASCFPNGYGKLKANGRTRLAHRVAYELVKGAIPPGSNVLHSCDNPPCVRPDHLRLGSQKDNIADMDRKGRRPTVQTPRPSVRGDSHWRRRNPERGARGESAGASKLTEQQVRDIREQAAEGWPLRALGKAYGVSGGTVTFIVQRKTWKHVE